MLIQMVLGVYFSILCATVTYFVFATFRSICPRYMRCSASMSDISADAPKPFARILKLKQISRWWLPNFSLFPFIQLFLFRNRTTPLTQSRKLKRTSLAAFYFSEPKSTGQLHQTRVAVQSRQNLDNSYRFVTIE